MKLASILLATLVSVVIQIALARYTIGGRWVFDFVLVGVLVVSLQWGPVAGIVAGTVGGLLEDVLAGGVVGVGGLSKTIVGYCSGVIGAQFVLVRPHVRTAIVAVSSLVHRLMIVGLYGLIDHRWPRMPWGAMLAEMAINAVAAFIVFQASVGLPGMVARQRASRRSTFGRRQW